MIDAAIYTGTLRHRRFRPTPHAFTYRVFFAYVNLEHVAEIMAVSRLTGYNRRAWASFYEADHFGDPATPLHSRVRAYAQARGVSIPDGPIYLLTHLRYFGYCFNPISLFYCCDRTGRPQAVLAEVNSTFGERALYWIPAPERPDGPLRHRVTKQMHVSPFNTMDLDYVFGLSQPGESLVAHMDTVAHHDAEPTPFFDATLTLTRTPWSAAGLRQVLLRHPWMTASVITAIHWQAFRLWWKGQPYIPHPQPVGARKTDGQDIDG